VQTAEGALNEIGSLLQRIRELAVQSSNGTLGTSDQNAISDEVVQLRNEIDRIAAQTEFNGTALLTGSLLTSLDGTSQVSVGTAVGTLAAVFSAVDVASANAGATYTISNPSGTTVRLTRTVGGTAVTQDITAADLSSGGSQTFNYSQFNVKFTVTGTAATQALLAANLANAANDAIITNSTGGSLTVQVGADAGQTMSVSISDSGSDAIGTTVGTYTNLSDLVNDYDGNESTLADDLITMVDGAVEDVSGIRSGLGAAQNRLNHAIANLGVGVENLSASEPRIRDADIATETVEFVKAQILQQAGVAVLAQANSAPQSVLALLT
jgi:flagellin